MKFKLESFMMFYGYKLEWLEGVIKCFIFQMFIFVFKSVEEGKVYFELAYGFWEFDQGEVLGFIYSWFNNFDLEIFENWLCFWDEAEECVVFESGMFVIFMVMFVFLKLGDVLLYSKLLYGGIFYFIIEVFICWGVEI